MWHYGIAEQMHKFDLRGNMLRFMYSFLSERYIKVRIGNKISAPYIQREGVPQGSVLSVTCFSVAINEIIKAVQPLFVVPCL